MTSKSVLLTAAATIVAFTTTRPVGIDLVCSTGCTPADSLQVTTALRAGLTQAQSDAGRGRGTMVRVTRVEAGSRTGPIVTAPVPALPLTLTGHLSFDGAQARVAAELFEGQRSVGRDTILVAREELEAQAKRLGIRLGAKLADR